MEFRIAETFTDSLSRLTGEEQKVVKTTAFDLQLSLDNPRLRLDKLEFVEDKNFWSVWVNRDIGLIVHKTELCLLLCYVGNHESSYKWAERRKLETHPTTGAAQFVEVRENLILKYAEVLTVSLKPLLFVNVTDDQLLNYGVPVEWLDLVRAANDDTVLELADHLPNEAAEALLDLAIGIMPQVTLPTTACVDPFDHPDAQRRFRVMNNVEELERALEYPWEKWAVFLHPAQRQLIERNYNGPARISGSAGTGKTVVALHRAVFLARANPHCRVLVTTFSDTLANALKTKLKGLIGNEPRIGERLEVYGINAIGRRLFEMNFGRQQIASREVIQRLLIEVTRENDLQKFSLHFLMTEWEDVVDAWQLETWESYRDVLRLGRKTRLPEKQREKLWSVFNDVRSRLKAQKIITYSYLFNRLVSWLTTRNHPLFDFVVVDEAQDVTVAQLGFIAALGHERPDSLFFTGDLGQRVFQQPFSWKAIGVDIRGRSSTLHINYRTSHQIRIQADRLLGPKMSDVDGNTEGRRGTISIFNGPNPTILLLDTPEDEIETVSHWLVDRINEGIAPNELGVFVRSPAELTRACAAVERTGLQFMVLDGRVLMTNGRVTISTMHLAKGLEFRAVVVMACDNEVIPLKERIEAVADDTDLEDVYNTERHLLYVACTRARDHLLVTSVDPASEFIDDLRM